jgi:hypothetical protein
VAKPETILGWYRKLVAKKFDGSKSRSSPGRPRVDGEIESLIVRMAKENPSWGYDRIVGALGNLGYPLSDQTVGNILRRHGVAPAPRRKHTVRWKDFIRTHLAVLTGTDFFTRRSPDMEGPGYVLCGVLHSPGEPAGMSIRNHATSGSGVDGTAGADRDFSGVGLSAQVQVSIA